MSLKSREVWESGSVAVLILSSSLILVTLPFYITFNEFLTSVVKAAGLWFIIDSYVAPLVAGLTTSLLQLMNVKAVFNGPVIYISDPSPLSLYVAWNCVGWQSLIIFAAIAYLAMKDADLPRSEKVLNIILGLQGTVLVNILRIALVGLVAVHLGKMQAILFHDYAGTLISLAWLLGFWYLFTSKSSSKGEDGIHDR
ncbi:MAG: exosortase/archaeosortase family protein [Candidatus Caldarchaeum sp.]|nr:exosortase/archaeosortase family protein [Candidatus Caldarchaeum sp.]